MNQYRILRRLDDIDIQNCLTPYKRGIPVLVGSGVEGAFDYHAVDCPFVFRHNERFYMMYVGFDGKGYQTALAVSDDLLHWEHLAIILKRDENGSKWDSRNVAGTWILRDNDLHGAGTLKNGTGSTGLPIIPILVMDTKKGLPKLVSHGLRMKHC